MKNKFLSFFSLFIVMTSFSQERNKSILKPYKLGFLYNFSSNENFIFDDVDYTYITNTYKAQVFYKLGKWKNINLELIVQPQVQFLKHQLINEQFITPDQENYLEKRTEFTKVKMMNLYGLEFGFGAKKEITEKLNLQGTISLGLSFIDTRTERLTKGFTFIENFSLGFSYKIVKNSYLYIGTNFGHVSNLNFQKPNDGYNVLGIEIGYSYVLE
ncbi:Lipid A 3-O-deacylase (PagL) [Polaribacter sp. Hel1_33_78]|uniref:acyloxyacyl hydrolase n=1 Tax=Polaribacter sp. Hel1_33_78 TaxID=1336804 RepID=UPI000879EBAA|nr:acyloxyacyl hydrolase [Polaribacter sp. Hel1_33_78]SDU09001.1 Lipid A 3-O-deacylase (PagL) [Polaribacter sp. Hel1_33_78]